MWKSTIAQQMPSEGDEFEDAQEALSYPIKSTDITEQQKPAKAKMKDNCLLKDGTVTFCWYATQGIKMYRLVLKDEMQKHLLNEKEVVVPSEDKSDCKVTFEFTEKLRPGETCMAKVFTHAVNGEIAETDWKPFFIGGEKNPRNVKAMRDMNNPRRSVLITFDLPRRANADEFRVVAVPNTGKSKCCFVKTGNMLFSYLRSGVTYKFEVSARYGNNWSQPSVSNSITTQDHNPGAQMMTNHYIDIVNLDLTGANIFAQAPRINLTKDKDFAKVCNLKHCLKCEEDRDLLEMTWYPPSFGNFEADYKVEEYIITLRKEKFPPVTNRVAFDSCLTEYSYKVKLDLGHKYELSISTAYEDIDEGTMYRSNYRTFIVYSRPCKPEVIQNHYADEAVEIRWRKAFGAIQYQVEIYTEGETRPTLCSDVGKSTWYKRNFDVNLGYGIKYYAKLIAIGQGGQVNYALTEEKAIGGGDVPLNIVVTCDHSSVTDPNTQVYLCWDAPLIGADHYIIETYSISGEKTETAIHGKKSCVLRKLKSGEMYYFKVSAVHLSDTNQPKRSGGTSSKRIQTLRRPPQVRKVQALPGDNLFQSIDLSWDKVDVRKEDESIKYNVCLKRWDKQTEQKSVFLTESVTLNDLCPGESYVVTVAAGNSDGYGPASDAINFTIPDLGEPKDVLLKNVENFASTSLSVEFKAAFGNPLYHEAELIQYEKSSQVVVKCKEKLVGDCSHVFKDLVPNTLYMSKVCAVYAEGVARPLCSDKVWTAPLKVNLHACCCIRDENGVDEINAKWHASPGCNLHEVEVMYGEDCNSERKLFTETKAEFSHHRVHTASQYSIKVRTRNGSGYFSEWSDEQVIFPEKNRVEPTDNITSDNSEDVTKTAETDIIICPGRKHLPYLPGTEIRISPIIDFNSIKKRTLKTTFCKSAPPYMILTEQVEIELLRLEDEWRYFGTTSLTTIPNCATPASDNELLFINKKLEDLRGIQFSIISKLFIDYEYNVACITCLDYKRLLEKEEKVVVGPKGYFASPILIKAVKLRIGDSMKFILTSPESGKQISCWSVILNEEFIVHDRWCDIQTFDTDLQHQSDKKLPKLSLTRVINPSGESRTYTANVPFQAPLKVPGAPYVQTISANTVAQLGGMITQTDNESTKNVSSTQNTDF